MRKQTNFLPYDPVLPNLPSLVLLRQVLEITFAKNMRECVQWASKDTHFTTFLFFFTLSTFNNQHNCNKKKPQLPYYGIAKQCVSETPLSFKSVRRKSLCTYSTAAGILVKVDTNLEMFEWWGCSQGRGGRRTAKQGKLDWQAEWRAEEWNMKGQKRQEAWEGLQMCWWDRPLIPSFHVSVFLKFKERQLSARWEVAFGTWF